MEMLFWTLICISGMGLPRMYVLQLEKYSPIPILYVDVKMSSQSKIEAFQLIYTFIKFRNGAHFFHMNLLYSSKFETFTAGGIFIFS